MKTILLPFILLFSIQVKAQYWVQLNSGTTTNLRDVFFVSSGTGYVVGEDSIVLKTVDYGLTWNPMPNVNAPNPGNLNAIWMTNANTGFVAPEFLADIPHTVNGGLNWTPTGAMIGNPCNPDGLFFDGPNEGYIYGHGCFGGAYIAHYNGSTWDYSNMLDYTSTVSNPYVGIRGMAKDPVGNEFVSWDTIPYPDTTNFSAVDHSHSNTFYASSTAIINSIYVSTDGGNSFAYDTTYAPTFYYSGFYDIDMADEHFGVAGGFSLTTGRGFIQWRRMNMGWMNYEPVDHIIRAVYVIDSLRAFAVGDSGAIYAYSPIPVGLNEMSAKQHLKAFPSPLTAGEQLTIDLPAGESWSIEVFDVQGRKTGGFSRGSGKQQIALPDQSGIYLVKATYKDKLLVSKVLVE
jgi:hypothetical protein